MPGYYTYLISSLPMLHFGTSPPLSFEEFIQACAGQLSEDDVSLLRLTSLPEASIRHYRHPGLRKWYIFETSLRNELAKIRAGRKKTDPLKYVRAVEYAEPSIIHLALNASRNPSILEAERMLDEARWRMLEDLSVGHYFDIDFLLIYALKLLILERWEKIRAADRARLLENAVSSAENA